jgi:hypothetical protein
MSEVHSPLGAAFARPLVRGGIAVAGLFILRALVLRFPVVSDAAPIFIPSLFTDQGGYVALADIVRSVFDALMFVVALGTARDIRGRLRDGPTPALGTCILWATVALVVALAYASFAPALPVLIGDPDVYTWLFLLIGGGAVAMLAATLYRNLDAFTDFAVASGRQLVERGKTHAAAEPSARPIPACPGCGAAIVESARFCGACGQAVVQAG